MDGISQYTHTRTYVPTDVSRKGEGGGAQEGHKSFCLSLLVLVIRQLSSLSAFVRSVRSQTVNYLQGEWEGGGRGKAVWKWSCIKFWLEVKEGRNEGGC